MYRLYTYIRVRCFFWVYQIKLNITINFIIHVPIIYMGVSLKGGTRKSSILDMGFPLYTIQPFGYLHFWKLRWNPGQVMVMRRPARQGQCPRLIGQLTVTRREGWMVFDTNHAKNKDGHMATERDMYVLFIYIYIHRFIMMYIYIYIYISLSL
jgi:hypothetical protein